MRRDFPPENEANGMTLTDVLILVLVLVIIGTAAVYIRKEKKQGRCVGCPYAKECAAKKAGTSCGCQEKK